jgi:hypothetical protein
MVRQLLEDEHLDVVVDRLLVAVFSVSPRIDGGGAGSPSTA